MNNICLKSPLVVGVSIILCLIVTACGGKSPTTPDPPSTSGSPSTSSPPPTATRIIRLDGDLNFGNLAFVNSPVADRTLNVSNDGNDSLEISGLAGPCASTPYLSVQSAKSFTVAPGGTVPVSFRFAPTTRIDCSGTVTVFGNHTSGTNTIDLTARGVLRGCDVIPDPLPEPCLPPR